MKYWSLTTARLHQLAYFHYKVIADLASEKISCQSYHNKLPADPVHNIQILSLQVK